MKKPSQPVIYGLLAVMIAFGFYFVYLNTDFPHTVYLICTAALGYIGYQLLLRKYQARIVELEFECESKERAKDEAFAELGQRRIQMAWIDEVVTKAVDRQTHKDQQVITPTDKE